MTLITALKSKKKYTENTLLDTYKQWTSLFNTNCGNLKKKLNKQKQQVRYVNTSELKKSTFWIVRRNDGNVEKYSKLFHIFMTRSAKKILPLLLVHCDLNSLYPTDDLLSPKQIESLKSHLNWLTLHGFVDVDTRTVSLQVIETNISLFLAEATQWI